MEAARIDSRRPLGRDIAYRERQEIWAAIDATRDVTSSIVEACMQPRTPRQGRSLPFSMNTHCGLDQAAWGGIALCRRMARDRALAYVRVSRALGSRFQSANLRPFEL